MSSSNKSTILKGFNTHFFEFLQDLIEIFPENKEIQYAKKSFESLKQLNPSLLIKVWYSNIYTPYQDVISQGDISFFFNKNYEEDLVTVSNASEIIKIIDMLRQPISSMGENNKAQSMKYIQNLSNLSVIYSTGS